MLDRERLNRLVAEKVGPVVGLRSADAFQGFFPIIGNDGSGLLVVADRIFRAHHQVLMPGPSWAAACWCVPSLVAPKADPPRILKKFPREAMSHELGL